MELLHRYPSIHYRIATIASRLTAFPDASDFSSSSSFSILKKAAWQEHCGHHPWIEESKKQLWNWAVLQRRSDSASLPVLRGFPSLQRTSQP